MRKLLLAICFLLPALASAAVVVEGVKVPAAARVGGQQLVLNGAGLRSIMMIHVYVAALYLPEKKDTARDVLSLPGAKRISMTPKVDIKDYRLIEALNEGIRENHSQAEVEKLKSRMEALNAIMSTIGTAHNGAVINLDYVPGTGTQVSLNGERRGPPIAGEDFYRAILRIWLGEAAVDNSLKKALLG